MRSFQLSKFLQALMAIALAITITLIVGALLGFNTRPGQAEAVTAAVNERRAVDPLISPEDVASIVVELHSTHPAFLAPERHPVQAILIDHSHLLGVFLLFALLLLRPAISYTVVAVGLAAAILWLWVGAWASFWVALALLFYSMVAMFLGWRATPRAAA